MGAAEGAGSQERRLADNQNLRVRMYPLSHSSRFPKTAILGRGGEDEKPTASPLVADLRGYCRLYDVVAFFGQTGATALPGRFARPRHLSAPQPRGEYGPAGHPNCYWRNSPPKQKENGGGNHKRKTRPGEITIEKTRKAHLTPTDSPDRGRNEKRKKGGRSMKQDGTRRTKKKGRKRKKREGERKKREGRGKKKQGRKESSKNKK